MAQETQDLLNQISKNFSENCRNDKKLNAAYKAASGKNATYQDAAECADRVGKALAKAFKSNLSSAVLEGGTLSYEDAVSIIEPMLNRAYQMNTLACEKVQETLNKAAGLNLKAQVPELNKDRIDGFARRIGSEDNFDDVAWILDEPVKTYSRSVVDDSIKANADFHYKAGLSPKIIRTAEPKCCEWCASLAGEYDYPLEDTEVYRRHDNCRCVVEYKPGDGRAQNVHSKSWRDEDAIETRKAFSNPPNYFKQSGVKETGGHHYKTDSTASKRERQAADAYELIVRRNDAPEISRNTGIPEENITQIRRHIFFEKHKLYEGYGRFTADYDMAVAWERLRDGTFLQRDLTLLNHEYLESELERKYNLTASEAHIRANQKYNWEKQLFLETDGLGEKDGLL